jgi:ribosomal protein S18 acetylase RimI-like enzyme
MLEIGKLKKNDLRGLEKVYKEGFEGSTTNFERMLKTFDLIKNNPNYNVLCAKVNGKVVGSIMGVACYELFGKCQPFMVVENVVVLKEYRRKGIAKSLLIELEKRSKK